MGTLSDINQSFGGKSMILTANRYMILIVLKSGHSYIVHYYSNDKQMKIIQFEEVIESLLEWNPSLRDSDAKAVDQRYINSLLPQDIIYNFYNLQGEFIVQRNDTGSIVSDDSSTSSKSRHRSYQARTRKKKQKQQHNFKL